MTDSYDNLHGLLKDRYSCRAYKPDAVPADTIEAIIEAARHVPSWCNAQPWQVVVTSGKGTDRFREALMQEALKGTPAPDLEWPSAYTGVYKDRRRACGFQLYDAVGIAKGDRAASATEMMKNFALFGAPHVAIIHAPRDLGAYGALDCGAFITAFTLAAQALGVASIPQAAVASYGPLLHDHFGISDDRMILCGISFGYPDTDAPVNSFRTERAQVSDILDWQAD